MGRLLERLRKKFEAIEQKISSKSAKIQSKVRTQRVDVITPTGQLSRMKSSWIRSYAYDNKTKILYMTVHTGKTYQWDNVPVELAWKVIRGNATCTTDDKKKRWWVGKTPSLGAAYWQLLKPFSLRVTSTIGRIMKEAEDKKKSNYMDIWTDVSKDKSKDYHKQKSRPSDIKRNWERGLYEDWATKGKKPTIKGK